MKRTERHHLKENELANLAVSARDAVGEKGRQIGGIVAAVVLVLAAVIGYFTWQNRVEARADGMLADAMAIDDARVGPPPAPGQPNPGGQSFATVKDKYAASQAKFKAVADQYPSSDAGIFARYREAAAWMALGNPANAATAYQQVIDRGGSSLYGQMARLGLAEAQVQTGQIDPAINALKELSQQKEGALPVDGILMRLGRVYLDNGKTADAEQTFNRIIQEYPESPFLSDARRELAQMKKS